MPNNAPIKKNKKKIQLHPPHPPSTASYQEAAPSSGAPLDLRLHRRQAVMHIHNLLDLLWRR